MDFASLNNEYRVLQGKSGKRYYALTKKFWRYIEKQKKGNKFRTKRDFIKYLNEKTKGEISQKALEGWLYTNKKPILVQSFRSKRLNLKGCIHNHSYFCAICKLNKLKKEGCPVPLFWLTEEKGKLYVHQNYWDELRISVKKYHEQGFLISNLSSMVGIGQKTIRSWKNNVSTPKVFNDDNFTFSPHNSFFVGLYLSDGHIRNNGSNTSFTYQVGSSNLFQGYWYPQLIQRIFPIFKHKKKISNTYLKKQKNKQWKALSTNLSSISPIFIKKMVETGLITKKKKEKTSGYVKAIPLRYLSALESREELFQGVFDGDGTYNKEGSPIIDLATSPGVSYEGLISTLNLIPTLASHNKKEFHSYHKRPSNSLYMVRFAPASLKHLCQETTAEEIIQQLNFFLDAAKHSIRPDKVHNLTRIIEIISNKKYGTARNSLPIQKEIRILAQKRKLLQKAEQLRQQYKIKNGRYQQFLPAWAKGLVSRKEAWDFFINKENLIFKTHSPLSKLNLAKGVPLNFSL